jgi:hypothetical protein
MIKISPIATGFLSPIDPYLINKELFIVIIYKISQTPRLTQLFLTKNPINSPLRTLN